VLAFNRGHWRIQNSCHNMLDGNWDEDRGTIRTGHGPENITALRRFAIGILKTRSHDAVAASIPAPEAAIPAWSTTTCA
jgi:predicted transposase YbfD/YdcC